MRRAALALVAGVLALALAGCGDDDAGGDGDAGDGDAGLGLDGGDATVDAQAFMDGSPGAALGRFQLTYYWVSYEEDFTGAADTTLYDRMCRELAIVPAAFANSLRIEGTGRLADGRTLNVAGTCMCPTMPCYLVLDATRPWGLGVQNRPLVPFRSIAIDRNVLTIGHKLWVKELDGVRVPGEAPWGDFVHDGCVVADDVGGGITGMHIDWFVALREHYRTLNAALRLSNITLHDGGGRCN